MFAASLKEQAERLFPDVAMIGAVERDAQQINHLPAVVKFIDDHPEFDLSESNVAKFNIEAGDALTEEELAVARVMQRVRLTRVDLIDY